MRKIVPIALVLALVALAAYIAGTWYLGMQIEAALSEPSRPLANLPYLKVVKQEYRRGVFGSEQTVTFELFGDMTRKIDQSQQQRAASAPEAVPKTAPLQAMHFTVRSHIKHGPLPDGQTPAAAIVDSELEMDQMLMPLIAKGLAGRTLLTTRTVYGFKGEGESVFTSPDLAITVADAPGRITWKGASATVRFNGDWSSYTIAGEAPGLDIAGNAMHLAIAGMRFESEAQRVFADEPLFYAGKQKFSVAQASVDGSAMGESAVMLKRIGYDVSIPVNGEFIDLLARIAVQDVLVGDRNFGPAHYDLSLKHLHARTVAQLQRALMKLQSDPSGMTQAGNPGEVFAALATPALKLLEFNPEISLDRISFKSGDAEVLVAARAKLTGVGPDDLKQPPVLLSKLDASADIVLPESLLMAPWGIKADSPEAAHMQMQMREKQLATLVEQGYVQREGALIKSTLGFSGGAFTVNGKPFDPRAMQAPVAQPSPPLPLKQPGRNSPLRAH